MIATLPLEMRSACALAERLRGAIKQRVGLTASVGVARTKLVARMLSPRAKPDGILAVGDANVAAFMAVHDIRRLPGWQS